MTGCSLFRRMPQATLFVILLAILTTPSVALAQSAVFVVRHAERADAGTKPPP